MGAQTARLSESGLGMAIPETWPRLTLEFPKHGATRAGVPAQPGGLQPNQHHVDRRTTEVGPAPWDTRGLCFRMANGIKLWPTHRRPRKDTAPRRLTGERVGHRRGGASENHKQPGWCRLRPQVVGAPATKMGKPGASTLRGDTGSQGRATPQGSQMS